MFHFTLTELLSLPLDILALMIHTWINHTARQTAAYSMIMQIRETPLGHAISTTACFLAVASMIIRRSAMVCAKDMHHWAATMRSSARDLFPPKTNTENVAARGKSRGPGEKASSKAHSTEVHPGLVLPVSHFYMIEERDCRDVSCLCPINRSLFSWIALLHMRKALLVNNTYSAPYFHWSC